MISAVEIKVTKVFKREVKRLLKKYPSLNKDLSRLQTELLVNPEMGTSLGNRAFKIRLSIRSKGKGKSGGARVITYLQTEIIGTLEPGKTTIVNLVSIYDKSEVSTITPNELRELIREMEFE